MSWVKRLKHFALRKNLVSSHSVPAQPKRQPTKCFTPYLDRIDTHVVEGKDGSALIANKVTGAPLLWASGTLSEMPPDIKAQFDMARSKGPDNGGK